MKMKVYLYRICLLKGVSLNFFKMFTVIIFRMVRSIPHLLAVKSAFLQTDGLSVHVIKACASDCAATGAGFLLFMSVG
jgi:hypothetical protein